ncbi:hypothetical protein EVAR_68264_1 [Eumeta japonica]|uniref:Uncharacterized protein n=1 Tax=Eumeta variegata TaxID=151549 RepID=A0A4C2AE43_EUMVA|nr:hypothetical protein EVAR_68264_1 [Eumeta japonica]
MKIKRQMLRTRMRRLESNFIQKQHWTPASKKPVGANFGTANLVTSMLRLVGFDATKLGALAINALIMIASAIGNTLMGTTTGQPFKNASHKFKILEKVQRKMLKLVRKKNILQRAPTQSGA